MSNGQIIETPDSIYGGNERGANLPLNISSNKLEAARVVKSGPGLLYGFTVNNTKASAQYILVFDASTLPGSGIVPVCSFTAAASTNLGVNWLPARTFNTGIVLANSSTADSLTAGSADCFFDVQFV